MKLNTSKQNLIKKKNTLADIRNQSLLETFHITYQKQQGFVRTQKTGYTTQAYKITFGFLPIHMKSQS